MLLSGGMDSTVCLLRSPGYEAVAINYGQPFGELYAAEKIAKRTGTVLHRRLLEIPGAEKDDRQHEAFMPGRNLMLLTLAATLFAGDVTLVIGAVREDQEGFPDCRPGFFEAAAKTLSLGLDKNVRIVTPLIELTKAEVVASLTNDERRIVALSVSCYRGEQCGTCGACLKRKAAGL